MHISPENSQNLQYRFDFLKLQKFWLICSLTVFVIGAAAYVMRGGFRYHIDFTGGSELLIAMEKPTDISKIRDVINEKVWKDAVIQCVGSTGKEFLIRMGDTERTTEQAIKDTFVSAMPDNKMSISSIQRVGSTTGKDTTKNAVIAIFLALLILLLYIAIRFEFRFGLGALASLVHDVSMMLTFLILTGEPVSLHILASVLAVMGYSLNDTIVIFSRMRENFKKNKGASEYDLANLSINQTLKRTILVSSSTFVAVSAIYVFGGETLRGLSKIMLLGIIVGTYSSIYIASPVALFFKKEEK